MITTTIEYIKAVEDGNYPNDPRVPLDHKFEDERGIISNLLHTPIMSVAMITSKKGSVRAQHAHTLDHHYSFIISGKIEYFERDMDGKEKEKNWIIGPNEMFYTKPKIWHKMLFLENSIMITFSKIKKDHEGYETDVVRIKFDK